MHRKIPGFHFSSEPSQDGSEAPRRSRSLFSKLTKSSSRDSGSGRRSPSPYAGRSETGGRRRAGDSRASSPERSGAYSDADGDSDSDGGALSSSERVGPGSSRRYSSGTAFSGGVGADSSAGEETQSEFDYSEQSGGEDDSSDSFDEELDEELIANTEANAGSQTAAEILLAQPATTVEEGLEDGPNLVKSPASPFALSSSTTSARRPATAASTGAAPASSVSTAYRTPRRRKSTIKQDFQLVASRPSYERNRCSITLTHGDPEGHMASLREAGTDRRRSKTYVVASDLSEESYYAIEWAIGTVLRNGDELLFVTVMETDSKLDPEDGGSSTEKTNKIRNQQERQTRVLQLSREATALLERTRLHVRVQCQAIHAKNARHMLIDLIDYFQPTLVLVGSRGLGKLKGTILGSMSHYLIQKSSAPVMVTRRRLKPVRRPRKPISDLQRAPRVGGLANATIDTESHTGMLPPTGSAAEAALLKKQQDAAAGKGDDGETDTEGRASFRS